ncbi:MAG: flavodoxin family protein [Nitrospiraceae bacterium]|nr:flavodoxin family protein [Nitrospiraceae bacterium]
MRITVFNGSPRGANGNTHTIAEAFGQGAMEAGAEVDHVFLVKKDIRFCTGCFGCWLRTPGECIHKDDVPELLEKFVASDVIVFATPVYVDNVTGIMKTFMDRLIPLADPHFEKTEDGECRHFLRFDPGKKFVIISSSGFPEIAQFQVLRLLFRRVARNFQCVVVGEIYRGGGEMMGVEHPLLQQLLDSYKRNVRKAGVELVEKGCLSEETMAALELPLVPEAMYVKAANEQIDNSIRKFAALT